VTVSASRRWLRRRLQSPGGVYQQPSCSLSPSYQQPRRPWPPQRGHARLL